jgi:hypothetical protein
VCMRAPAWCLLLFNFYQSVLFSFWSSFFALFYWNQCILISLFLWHCTLLHLSFCVAFFPRKRWQWLSFMALCPATDVVYAFSFKRVMHYTCAFPTAVYGRFHAIILAYAATIESAKKNTRTAFTCKRRYLPARCFDTNIMLALLYMCVWKSFFLCVVVSFVQRKNQWIVLGKREDVKVLYACKEICHKKHTFGWAW